MKVIDRLLHFCTYKRHTPKLQVLMTFNDSCLAWLRVIHIQCTARHLPSLSETLRRHSLPCYSPHGVGLVTPKCAVFLGKTSLCLDHPVSSLRTKTKSARPVSGRASPETGRLQGVIYVHQSSSERGCRPTHPHRRGRRPGILGPLPKLDLL